MKKNCKSKKYSIRGIKAQVGLEPDTNQDINGNPLSPTPNRYTKDADGNLIDNLTGEVIYKTDPNQFTKNVPDAMNTINRKEIRSIPGSLQLPKWLQMANLAVDATTGIANIANDFGARNKEKKKYLEAIQPRAYYNPDQDGLNDIPPYFEKGGHTRQFQFQAGGQGSTPILAEAGEVYSDVDGGINKIHDNADTHDDASGGVQIHGARQVLEDTGDKRKDIDSKLLLIQPKELLEMSGAISKKPVTHSKAFELISKKADKDTRNIEKYLKRNDKSLDDAPNDIYAKNSMNLNINALSLIPTKNDIFQNLFNHQEGKKAMYGISNDGKAQNGAYVDTAEDIQAKKALKFLDAKRKKDPKFEDVYNNYRAAVNEAIGNDTPLPQYDMGDTRPLYGDDVFSSAGYKTLFPQGVNDYGKAEKVPNTQHARGNGFYGTQDWNMQDFYNRNPWIQQERPKFDPSNSKDVKWFQNEYNNRSNDYFGIPYFNGSGHRKVDGLFGQGTWSVPGIQPEPPQDTPPAPAQPNQPQVDATGRRLEFTPNSGNRFNAPLRWYDTLPATAAFIDGLGRHEVKYNGLNLQEPDAKYLNPLPALQEGQRSFNAALDTLPQTGAGMANQANLFGKKYGLDSKTLGDYQNANNQIWNTNQTQRINTRNTQAQADQQAREVFETKRLDSLEAQRQQLFQSMKDLTGVIGANAKYNREGNLLMKLFPAFNQSGDYSGYKYNFTSPSSLNTFQSQLAQLEGAGVKLSPSQKLKLLKKNNSGI